MVLIRRNAHWSWVRPQSSEMILVSYNPPFISEPAKEYEELFFTDASTTEIATTTIPTKVKALALRNLSHTRRRGKQFRFPRCLYELCGSIILLALHLKLLYQFSVACEGCVVD